MSDHAQSRRQVLHRRLFETASVGALLGLSFAGTAAADPAQDFGFDHAWLNVDYQFSGEAGGRTIWAQPGGSNGGTSMPDIGLRNGMDLYGNLTLQSGDWFYLFDANYGHTGHSFADYSETKFNTGHAIHHETHVNLDFMVGQNVGLGMFGLEGTSLITGGVQYGRFVGQTASLLTYYGKYTNRQLDSQFWGVGPVISWRASTPICHDYDLSIDWGIRGSVLFGTRSFEIDGEKIRDVSVALPQVGAYLGLDWHLPGSPFDLNAGYGVTTTFGQVDAGLVQRDLHADRTSFGPFVGFSAQLY